MDTVHSNMYECQGLTTIDYRDTDMHLNSIGEIQVLTTSSMRMTAFRDISPYTFVEVN
jgi:hypothetical protein